MVKIIFTDLTPSYSSDTLKGIYETENENEKKQENDNKNSENSFSYLSKKNNLI